MWFSPAYSQTDQRTISPQEMFNLALEKYKTKDYVQSRQLFRDLLSTNTQDSTLLYNLGLVEYSDNHQERALAYWRRALFLSPGHGPSLEGISQLKTSISYPWPLWLYWRIPIAAVFLLALFFWCAAGALIVKNIRRIKNNKSISWTTSALFSALCLLFMVMSAHYYYSQFYLTSATLVTNTPAAASPTNDAPSLFDFKEGDQVVVLRTQNEWLHVKKTETAVGWVKNSALIVHSGT